MKIFLAIMLIYFSIAVYGGGFNFGIITGIVLLAYAYFNQPSQKDHEI